MRRLTSTEDKKIAATNHLLEMTIGEYLTFANDIITNNDLQRKRVKTASRTYALLKDDLKTGCVIPPIVLAIFPREERTYNEFNSDNLIDKILTAGNDLIILDGLQRTFTILDLASETAQQQELYQNIMDLKIRIEVYTGISKVGVLYRMLTLNTGQNPMSTRHQVEMLYSDYKNGFDGFVFITEAQDRVPSGENEFRFSDVLDCFLSYITGDYLPLDREDLIKIIKNLENLTKDDKQKDIFRLLVKTYNDVRLKLNSLSNNWRYQLATPNDRKPFGFTVNDLFSKVQSLAGYGSALSFLINKNLIDSIDTITELTNSVTIEDPIATFDEIIKNLDFIQINAKKIGNEQRMYFYYLYRNLFNSANDGYLNLDVAVQQAFTFYRGNTLY